VISVVARRQLLVVACAASICMPAIWAQATDARASVARERPNVVVLVLDTLRADHIGAYGGRALTPNIDRLARRGLRFTRFFNEAMPTIPARRSIMTGRRVFPFRRWHPYPGLYRAPGWAPIADAESTFTGVMRRRGYWTSYVTDNPFIVHAGVFRSFRLSFDHFADTRHRMSAERFKAVTSSDVHRWLVPEARIPGLNQKMRRFIARTSSYWRDEARSFAAHTYTTAAAVLERAHVRQPFALVVDTFEPHEPWTPPRHYIDIYRNRRYRGSEPGIALYNPVRRWLSEARAPQVVSRLRDVYAAEVTMTDRWLGVLLERLDALGLRKNTIVVLTADHGHLLGDHGWTGKSPGVLHPALIQTPLILTDPRGRMAGRAADYFASTHDIGPTLLAMSGLRRPKAMNGVNLAPLLRGDSPPTRMLAYGGYGNYFFARTGRWALISDNRGRRPRLFNLNRDPRERHDVAERHSAVVHRLMRQVVVRAGGRLPYYRYEP
jgi:arylsulfatase A-like enzyme